jgi:hypothetical protein
MFHCVLQVLLVVCIAAVVGRGSLVAQALDAAAIRNLIAAGGVDEARHLLTSAPRTREYLELRFDLERKARNVPAAVAAWEALAQTAAPDWDRLKALATDVAASLRGSSDPVVRVQACGVLLRAKQTDCAKELQSAARDSSLPWALRLMSAKQVAANGDRVAKDELTQLASEAVTTDPAAALEAMADAEPVAAVATFSSVLAAARNPQQQYQAAYLIGDAGSQSAAAGKQAVAALGAFLGSNPRGPARAAAIISLARVGETEHVAALRESLPQLGGYDRLMAGVALAERGDREGAALIRSTASTLSEHMQLEAAVRLAPFDRSGAVALMTAQIRSSNPVARGAALQAWPQLKAAPPEAVRKALGEDDPATRMAAAVAITTPFTVVASGRRP